MLNRKVYPIQADTEWKQNLKTRKGVPQDGSGRTALGRVYRAIVEARDLGRFFADDDPAKPVYEPVEPGLLLKCQQINLYNNPLREYDRWRDYYKHGIGDEDDFDDDVDYDDLYEKNDKKRYQSCSACDHYRVVKFRSNSERFFIARLYERGYGSKVRFIAGTTSPEFWDRVIKPYCDENAWIALSKTRPMSISERAIASAVNERQRKAALALAEAEAERGQRLPQDPVEGLPLFGGDLEPGTDRAR